MPHLLVALGIIYGDIGTSPLYVLSSIIGKKEITEELVYGGISCVFWTLTLQTTFKYILLHFRQITGAKVEFFLCLLLYGVIGDGCIPCNYRCRNLIGRWNYYSAYFSSSAIEGLSGVNGLENLIAPGNTLTVGIIIGILSLLFFFQQFGTNVSAGRLARSCLYGF